jgi:hypothetical protein
MRATALILCLLVAGCAQRPWIGVTVTNAPASFGNCMPDKPSGGCP